MKKITLLVLMLTPLLSFGQVVNHKLSVSKLDVKKHLNENKFGFQKFQNINTNHPKISNIYKKNIPDSFSFPKNTNKKIKINKEKRSFSFKSKTNIYEKSFTSSLNPLKKLSPLPETGEVFNDVYGNRLDSIYENNYKEIYLFYDDDTIEYNIWYEYDDNGNEVDFGAYAYNYGYNNNGELTYVLEFDYNDNFDRFEPYYLVEYVYNNDNISVFNYYYDESIGGDFSYRSSSKEVYIFDDNLLNIDVSYYYYWSESEESFKINDRSTYFYENDKLDETYHDSWDSNQSEFINYSADTYLFYEGTNQLKQENTYYWSSEDQSYSPGYAIVLSYFDNNSIKEYIDYDFDESLQDFVPSFSEYFNDMTENETNILTTGDNYIWDSNFDRWEGQNDNVRYYYTKNSTLSIPNTSEISTNIFPNPTSNYLTIKSQKDLSDSKFELFDIAGKKVYSTKLKESNIINIENLQSSVYFYKLYKGLKLLKTGSIIKN